VTEFKIPLHEVCAQLDLVPQTIAELRANSFFSKLSTQYPSVEPLPVLLGPAADQLPEAVKYSPAYRFYSDDRSRLVQYGPRILAINFLQWSERFPGFRSGVQWVVDAYEGVSGPPTIEGRSLGFYNRLIVSSLPEASNIISLPLDIRPDTEFKDFVHQTSRQTALGTFLTQITIGVPDAFTPSPYLAFNLILRLRFPAAILDRSAWFEWLDRAHEFIRGQFGESLTPKRREQWEATWRESSASTA
jgi:uncharacterized protein (TIGR04255 family)